MEDILLDNSTDDLIIEGGDFRVGEATKQHQKHLLIADKGTYKQHPIIGVGIEGFLDDESPDELLREIRRELVRDGQKVKDLKVLGDGSIGIDANY